MNPNLANELGHHLVWDVMSQKPQPFTLKVRKQTQKEWRRHFCSPMRKISLVPGWYTDEYSSFFGDVCFFPKKSGNHIGVVSGCDRHDPSPKIATTMVPPRARTLPHKSVGRLLERDFSPPVRVDAAGDADRTSNRCGAWCLKLNLHRKSSSKYDAMWGPPVMWTLVWIRPSN